LPSLATCPPRPQEPHEAKVEPLTIDGDDHVRVERLDVEESLPEAERQPRQGRQQLGPPHDAEVAQGEEGRPQARREHVLPADAAKDDVGRGGGGGDGRARGCDKRGVISRG
jgi:hypothetical protein